MDDTLLRFGLSDVLTILGIFNMGEDRIDEDDIFQLLYERVVAQISN